MSFFEDILDHVVDNRTVVMAETYRESNTMNGKDMLKRKEDWVNCCPDVPIEDTAAVGRYMRMWQY